MKLGVRRLRSDQDYRAMQTFIAEETVKELQKRGVKLAESTVLELGAGRGGYSSILNDHSREFLATDLQKAKLYDETDIPFKELDVLKPFPFEDNSFDFIYSSSLIEHVQDPTNMLYECKRILRPGGRILISFPPFYSLLMVGGHHFKPFHFLGERVAIAITNRLRNTNAKNYATCYGDFGLFPLTINQVKHKLSSFGFTHLDTYTRMSPINTATWPGYLKDLFTWHVCYLAQKP